MTQAPPSWIHTLTDSAIDMKAVPLSGFFPSFPWEEFSQKFSQLVEFPSLSISLANVSTTPYKLLSDGLGGKVVSIEIDATPLSGQAFFLMGKEDIDYLCSQILTHAPPYKGFSSSFLQDGFYRHLCTCAAALINELHCFEDLSIKIGKSSSLEQEDFFCIDIQIVLGKRSLFGRLACPASFHASFKTHFVRKKEGTLQRKLIEQIPLPSLLSIGSASLSPHLIKKLRTGDLVVLNSCLWDPGQKKGTAHLLLNGIPIFRVRLKDNVIKLLNYAIPEELEPMDERNEEESPFSKEEEEEFASIENSSHSEEISADAPQEEGGLISPEEIPIQVVVEVARMQTSLDQLLSLSPGNTLELCVRPEQGVYLTVQGKRIAKGELVQIGDLLGVRILQLGKGQLSIE